VAAYDLVHIYNRTPDCPMVSGKVSYFHKLCSADNYSMYKDWTAKSRGVCLLTEITATVQLKTGYTEVATPYQSAGTSISQFYVIFSNGGYQVTSSAPPTRIECFAVCKTARDTCCGKSQCLDQGDDSLYNKCMGEYLSCGGKCPQSPTFSGSNIKTKLVTNDNHMQKSSATYKNFNEITDDVKVNYASSPVPIEVEEEELVSSILYLWLILEGLLLYPTY
jgi:hypothetical protein